MVDPITDLFNRIKNAEAVAQRTTEAPFSTLKLSVVEILKDRGFLVDFKKRGRRPNQTIKIDLKYDALKQPALSGFRRISKPGQRIYKKAKEIRKVKDGFGVAIISTTKGLMTDLQARKEKVGGEVIVEVW